MSASFWVPGTLTSVDIVNPYVVDVMQEPFNAVGDGVTDDTVPLLAAIAYASTLIVDDNDGFASVLLRSYGSHAVSEQLVFPNKHRFHVQILGKLNVIGWSLTETDPLIDCQSKVSQITLGGIDCNNLCSGMDVSGNGNVIETGFVRHMKGAGYGLKHSDGGGNLFIRCFCQQWVQSDPEFAVDAEWTAIGHWSAGPDSSWFSCNGSWCLYPLFVESTAKNTQYINCHWFQGRPDAIANGWTLPDNPTIIRNESGSSQNFLGCYFDNGHIDCYDDGVIITGGFWVNAVNNVILDHPYIRVYRDQTQDDPNQIRLLGIRATVGFYDGTEGAWNGSYTDINAENTDILSGETHETMRLKKVIVTHDEDTYPTVHYMKPGGRLEFIYTTAGENTKVRSQGNVYEMLAEKVRISDLSNDEQWNFDQSTATSQLLPATDGTHEIGMSNKKLNKVFTDYLALKTSNTTPVDMAGIAQIWSEAGNSLKIKFGDGTVKTFTLV